MIPVSDDALYQFQMGAQLMQKGKIIKSQPLIKHKDSNHTVKLHLETMWEITHKNGDGKQMFLS